MDFNIGRNQPTNQPKPRPKPKPITAHLNSKDHRNVQDKLESIWNEMLISAFNSIRIGLGYV